MATISLATRAQSVANTVKLVKVLPILVQNAACLSISALLADSVRHVQTLSAQTAPVRPTVKHVKTALWQFQGSASSVLDNAELAVPAIELTAKVVQMASICTTTSATGVLRTA